MRTAGTVDVGPHGLTVTGQHAETGDDGAHYRRFVGHLGASGLHTSDTSSAAHTMRPELLARVLPSLAG